MSKAPAKPSSLVIEGLRLLAQRDALLAELAALEEQLIALGAGRYCAPDSPEQACTVVAAVLPSTGPSSFSLAAPAEDRARELAGVTFGKLFDRQVSYAPCQGFGDVAPKLLTPAKSRDLLALCFVPGKANSGKRAHVRW